MMQSDLAFSLVVDVVLILLVVLSHWLWRGGKATAAATKPPRAKRAPKPFAGLTRRPDCPACEQGAGAHPSAAPGAPVFPEYSYHARKTSIRVSREPTSGFRHQAVRVTTVSVVAFDAPISILPGALSTTRRQTGRC